MTVEGSISSFDTVTRYGEYGARRERDVSQDARWRSACTKLVREARASVIRLRVSIARLRLRISFMRLADEEKKEEALRRVLLLCRCAYSLTRSACCIFRSAQTAFR